MTITYLPLVKWRKNWFADGTQIRCRHCKVVWDLASARLPFTHAHDCKRKLSEPQYPLKDLHRIRNELDQAGLR